MPTDLPDDFHGTKPPPVDPAWVSPHRLASEPQREPLFAGQPLGHKILRGIVLAIFLVGLTGIALLLAAAGGAAVKAVY